jgi:23S rRNA pseudouridine1911/1915/1917 synthase
VARLPAEAGAALEGLGRQALHAYLLAVQHPTTGQQLEFRSELPVDLARLRHSLVTQSKAAKDPAFGKAKKPSRPKG